MAAHGQPPRRPCAAPEEDQAKTILATHTDKDWSLCDAISFAVLESRGARSAFTFDRHFRQYGRFEIPSVVAPSRGNVEETHASQESRATRIRDHRSRWSSVESVGTPRAVDHREPGDLIYLHRSDPSWAQPSGGPNEVSPVPAR